MPTTINDPILLEELGTGAADDELAVIVRLPDPDAVPRGVRIVTRFADIATVRIPRARLLELASGVTAVEAPRKLRPTDEPEEELEDEPPDEPDAEPGAAAEMAPGCGVESPYTRRPDGVEGAGRGCVVAALDWGLDFAHPAFRRADGSTRVLALWDQRGDAPPAPDNRWGYGRILTTADIDRALASDHPYQALDYDPADAGRRGGAHGTHVLDIAAGTGSDGAMPGVAPEADLVFVHLARTTDVLSPGNLGDSASVLEALDFVFTVAGTRPCVVNMSVGAHGGPHDGSTLVEMGIDRAVSLAPGRATVNSAGNYRTKRAHTTGRVSASGDKVVRFDVPAHDPTESELELYYSHVDRFAVEVLGPTGGVLAHANAGESLPLQDGDRVLGRVHHLTMHGTNRAHHVDVLLYPDAPGGTWALRLEGESVLDGRYHAWIERDRGLQPTFTRDEVVTSTTTGTLGNGRLAITCGCADPHHEPPRLASFSSGGPTSDGRVKPEVVAPGSNICAAQSTPRGEEPGARYVMKSGTSMASPHVAGTVALMFEAAGRPLEIYDTRALLFGSVDPSPFFNRPRLAPDLHRFGYGYLDIVEAERAARRFGLERERTGDESPEEIQMTAIPEWEEAVTPTGEPSELEINGRAAFDTGRSWLEHDDRWVAPPDDDPDEPVEPPRRDRSIRRAVASVSWVKDCAELQRLVLDALGLPPDAPLVAVADPGGTLRGDVRAGDLLVRAAPVAGGRYMGVVMSDRPVSWQALARQGVPVESCGPGGFVEVLEVPVGGGAPQIVGRRLTTANGRVPRYQQLRRVGDDDLGIPTEQGDVSESIDIDDVVVEMRGLRCACLAEHSATAADGSRRTFSAGARLLIQDWNGTDVDATIDGFHVPKLILEPAPEVVAGMRRYDVPLDAQRRAVVQAQQQLESWIAARPTGGAAERQRLEALVHDKGVIYSRMWMRQMMYNRFDVPIARWTRHYNLRLTPATDLDPDVVKSMAYQESRMGTSGRHLMPPPYDWSSATQHPVRSRFNILQAGIDSYGPPEWLLMREMAPSIFTAHRLDALEARAAWLGMSSSDYAAHPTFRQALREFFEHRDGGANLMGTPGVDLNEDYDFWIRMGIRWLFEKYARLRSPSWAEAVRAYNGSGRHARAYRDAVMARVQGDDAFAAEEDAVDAPPAAEETPELARSAKLTWPDLTRVRNASGDELLYYVVTGAPFTKAKSGDEARAIFTLRVENTNSVYNHKRVEVKWRLLHAKDRSRVWEVIRPWTKWHSSRLEDETSRDIPLHLEPDTLRDAYNHSDYPLTRLEVEYHWRERFFTSKGDLYYNRAGIDFWLVAPIEFMLSKGKLVSPPDVPLDDYAKHRAQFWIPLPGIKFSPELEDPVEYTFEIGTELRREETADKQITKRTSTTETESRSVANTFNLSLSGEASRGGTAKATVGIFELGLSEMFKLGASAGYSRTATDTSSVARAREFTEALRYSRSYELKTAEKRTVKFTVKRPQVPVPRGTGSRATEPVRGYGHVGAFLYPIVSYYEVPFVRFTDVNRFGQATRRVEGTVVVPFINTWEILTHAD